MQKLSVIIPAYNEEKIIGKGVLETDNSLRKLGINYEIIVVNDGSKDNTLEILNRIKLNKLVIVSYNKNKGKGYAIKKGAEAASGDFITFIDADLDLHPRQLGVFLKYMDNDVDIVIGSKRHKKSRIKYPLHRKLLSTGFQNYVKILFNLKVNDTQVGLKLFKTSVFKRILKGVTVEGFAFDLELIVIASLLKYKIVEAPIELTYQKGGGNVGLKSIIRMFFDSLYIFYKKNFLRSYDEI